MPVFIKTLIPNCSEYVSKLELSVKEKKYVKKRARQMGWKMKDYLDEYLKNSKYKGMFIGEDELKYAYSMNEEIKLLRRLEKKGVGDIWKLV